MKPDLKEKRNEIDKESLIKLGLDQGYKFSEEDLKELPEMSG